MATAGPVLWRGSPRSFEPALGAASGVQRARLGSDGSGRTAIVYVGCAHQRDIGGYDDCDLVRHRVADGTEKAILHEGDSYDLMAPTLDRGTLALGRWGRSAAARLGLWLRRPGDRLRRLGSDLPSQIDMARGRIVYAASRGDAYDFHVARAIDVRGRRPRYRTLATHDSSYEDGRIPGTTITRFDSVAVDGRYGYWLRVELRDDVDESRFQVWRADLDDPDAPVAILDLGHPARSIAVTGGRVYYANDRRSADRGIWEVRDPAWRGTGLTTPVND
jgi:hypothetical protein